MPVSMRDRTSVISVAAIALLANFLHLASFGLYDDDWYYMAPPWDASTSAWLKEMVDVVRGFYLGRPLQEICLRLMGLAGARLESVLSLYAIAAILYATCVVLVFRVLRLRYPLFFSTLAATLFAISPLTSVRQHLDVTLWGASGYICLCLAILAYARRKPAAPYVLAAAALLIYEPLFLVFAGAPFFRRGPKTRAALITHGALWVAILLAYLALRRALAEPRMVSVLHENAAVTLWRVIEFTGLFIVGSFVSYVYAAYVAVQEHPLEGLLWMALFAILLIGWFRSRSASVELRRLRWPWWLRRAVLPGLLFTALGYGVSYFSMTGILTYPVTGRDTRFSLAAAFGSSILTAGILCFKLAWFRSRWLKIAVRAGGIAWCLLLFLCSFVIQRDYIQQWQLHKKVLGALVAQSPDASPATLLILQRQPIVPFLVSGKRGPAIANQSHGLQFSFRRLFGHGDAPEIFEVFGDTWKNYLRRAGDGTLYWTARDFVGGWARDTSTPVSPIVLFMEDAEGNVRRVDDPVVIGGAPVNVPRDQNATAENSLWRRAPRSPLVRFVLPDLDALR
jgi:hypothetical protein